MAKKKHTVIDPAHHARLLREAKLATAAIAKDTERKIRRLSKPIASLAPAKPKIVAQSHATTPITRPAIARTDASGVRAWNTLMNPAGAIEAVEINKIPSLDTPGNAPGMGMPVPQHEPDYSEIDDGTESRGNNTGVAPESSSITQTFSPLTGSTGKYDYIIVESFRPARTSGHHGEVHIRPARNQIYPQTLFVQCNREMLDTSRYPIGTKFRWKVRLVTKASGEQFLGSYHSWPFDVVSEDDFNRQYGEEQIINLPTIRRETKPLPRPPIGVSEPEVTSVTTTTYQRASEVKAWVLDLSKGVCECCNRPAPFISRDGFPYLEVHHVKQLSLGGPDTTDNTVALCPNCHRELHHGVKRGILIEQLYKTVSRLNRY